MRVKLRKFLGQRISVKGTITGTGLFKHQLCINIKDISDTIFQEKLCDHIWIKVGKNLVKNDQEVFRGDVIRFEGRVIQYTKANGMVDFGFKNVSNVRIVNIDPKLVREKIEKKDLART